MMSLVRRLRQWSFGKLLVVSFLVFVVTVVLVIASTVGEIFYANSEGAGVGAVSISFSTLHVLLLFAPTVILVALWIWQRRAAARERTPA